MGEAKRRGTFDERVAQSQERSRIEYEEAKREHEERCKKQLARTAEGPRRADGAYGSLVMAAAAITAGTSLGRR